MAEMMSIEQTLAERGNRYGDFATHAGISQSLKEVMVATPQWAEMPTYQREALEMIAHKIARILNGDPSYLDNVVDIIGYSTLMLREMELANG